MHAHPESQPPSPDARSGAHLPAAARATLLVFTLGPDAEGRRRRLLPRRFGDRERALHRLCLDEALAAGEGAGCRLAVSSPAPLALPEGTRSVAQRGAGFGERLAAAFDEALIQDGDQDGEPGADPKTDLSRAALVAVGTDTPGIRREHVERALDLLGVAPRAAHRVVVGPSPDGGLYLLAAHRPLGDLLRRVVWCRKATLESLLSVLESAGLAVELMEPLADLDRPADLERWLARRSRSDAEDGGPLARLRALLGRLLAAWRRPLVARPTPRPRLAYLPLAGGRSPPSSHRRHR